MASPEKKKAAHRRKKALRVRKVLRTSGSRPRLSVFRSLKNIYCQVIDDASGRTLAAASSRDRELRDTLRGLKKVEIAQRIGQTLAERAKAAGVAQVAFDRGAYKFHGRVKALADAARAGGLDF
jgi:large subunit ribosomal protein L18